jgi:hypothetical protein
VSLLSKKAELIFFRIFFTKNHIFKSASKFGKNATAILQNATRCTLKKFGPILKLYLGGDTGCKIFPFFFPNWIAMRTLMRTVNFGKNLRLSQIQPIKTAGIKSIQFGKLEGKNLTPCIFVSQKS